MRIMVREYDPEDEVVSRSVFIFDNVSGINYNDDTKEMFIVTSEGDPLIIAINSMETLGLFGVDVSETLLSRSFWKDTKLLCVVGNVLTLPEALAVDDDDDDEESMCETCGCKDDCDNCDIVCPEDKENSEMSFEEADETYQRIKAELLKYEREAKNKKK